nr:heme-binding protein [Yoonia sp.]
MLRTELFPAMIVTIRSTLLLSFTITFILIGGRAVAYEEPRYEVVHRAEDYEVRRYNDRLAAQVSIAADQNNAFGLLFSYISGANQSSEKVSMTVPVAQSEKIDMTVPVAQSSGSYGGYMQFFLPAKFSLETAPRPTNPSVEIVVVKGGYFAVHRYNGRASDQNFARARTVLLSRLSDDGLVSTSEVIRATYNGPFTPPFMRRNEAMVSVSWP